MPKMIAFITGATGFVGSNLATALVDMGWDVCCNILEQGDLSMLDADRMSIHPGTLDSLKTNSPPALKQADIVFHAAGVTSVPTYEEYYKVNVLGTRAVLQACLVNCTKLKRFVYISSMAASGPGDDNMPISEDDRPRPMCKYGRSKLEAEQVVAGYMGRLPITIVRPGGIYGPGDNSFLVAVKMVKRGFFPILGSRSNKINLGFIRDSIRGIILAGEQKEAEGEVINIGGPNTTVGEFSKSMAKAAGCRHPKFFTLPPWLIQAAGWAAERARFPFDPRAGQENLLPKLVHQHGEGV
jgi:nucleoside-diphosphate-sugar epimerase